MFNKVDVSVERISVNAKLPQIMQEGDVAADLYAAEAMVIPARGRALVKTGLKLALPAGYRARIHSRSGLSLKFGIEAGAGLIDQGYRHELGVLLYNHSTDDFVVSIGDRIAQLCIESYTHPHFFEVKQVDSTERTAGWGSSGQR
jgi:dUTP pyrophosphatase